jgi:HK97 family phage major capsid protein
MAARTVQSPSRYSLLGLLAGDQYEAGLADISAARYGAPQLRGSALPTRALARDLGVAAAASGGNLVATELERVAAAVRPMLVLDQLGAQRLEVAGSEIALPKFDGGVGSWLGEGDQASSLSTTVPGVEASAKCAAARIALSRRMKNANRTDIEGSVLAEIERAVRSTIEAGFIAGDGTENQPLGLINAATGSKTFAGAVPTWAELIDMLEILGDADADLSRAAWLVHPSTAASLLKLQIDADGGELAVNWADGQHRIAGLPMAMTTACPEGKVVLGDFSTVTQVFFGAPQIIDDRFSAGKSISGASEIIVLNYCDCVLREPAHIVIGSA